MLDDPTTSALAISASQADWKATLTAGDIVAYRFPVAEEDGTAAPKMRPCLVLDIETIGGALYALLAYGTSAVTAANKGYEVRVRSGNAVRAAGLHRPTRFVGARRLMVPLDGSGFAVCAATNSPILGRLDETARKRMNSVRTRIRADRENAADRRVSRRRASRALPPFTGEARYPERHARCEGGAA
tara:strand:- start:454 stop:1014 length:561 start_codon:yes stop_codon:yes gene_type:complete